MKNIKAIMTHHIGKGSEKKTKKMWNGGALWGGGGGDLFNFGLTVCIIKDWPKWLFYTWVGHGKRPEREARRSFTVANPGVKKPFWPVFCSI